MARKKTERKASPFNEAVGFKNMFNNEKVNFILGLVLLLFAIYIIIAFVSYFSTGAADQSLVLKLRPGEVENSSRVFQNTCGSVGALLSYFFVARCFGIPAFLIPLFMLLAALQLMNAYKVNLLKWFMGTMLVMIWSSVTFAKFVTPMMSDSVFNPGGGHGMLICRYLENMIGSPGLIAILLIVAIGFLTYLSSETITNIQK